MIQRVIKIGSSSGITLPAKELKVQGVNVGDLVEVSVKPFKQEKNALSSSDIEVLNAAKAILVKHKKDFKNLADR